MMEELGNYIDSVIYNGSLVTISSSSPLYEEIFSDATLETLVIRPLREFVFKGFSEQVKEAFYSKNGALPMCTKLFDSGDTHFSCLECQGDETCVMCQGCFLNSIHITHEYRTSLSHGIGGCCDCGDVEAWKYHPTCSIHQISTDSKPLNEDFIHRLSLIIKYICHILEKIANDDFSKLESELLRMRSSYEYMKKSEKFDRTGRNWIGDEYIVEPDNDQSMCLLVFNDECHDYSDVVRCFKTCLPTSGFEAENLTKSINDIGYSCVLYRTSSEECYRIKNLIENFPTRAFSEFPLLCKVVPVQIIYFIRLSRSLIKFIHEFCSTKTQLCDLLSHILFRDTSLADIYIMKERHLWKDLRYDVIYKLFLLILYSDYGKTYITGLYLNNLDHIYINYMIDDHDTSFCFVNLTVQFITCPSLVTYLVENEFLVKMVNCLTRALRDINISKGARVSQIQQQGILKRNKCSRIFTLFKSIHECLMTRFSIEQWSDKFRSEVAKYGKSLIEFCYCFDDLEPLRKIHDSPEYEVQYSYTINLVLYFHCILINSSKWLFSCPEIVSEMLFKFLSDTQQEINSFLYDKTVSQAVQELMTFNNVENSEFSVFNISRRFYIDTLIRSVIEKNPDSRQHFEQVVKNDAMLVWVSLPSVTSISFYTNFLSATWTRNSTFVYSIFHIYHSPNYFHYFYMQDFTVIQILMAHMPPDRFVKYLIFNMIPSIREKVDLSQPLSSILSFVESEHDIAFREVMALIYNAMSERHFVGQVEDYGSFLIERQLIHYLACADRTRKNISDDMYFRRDVFTYDNNDFSKYLDDALQRVAYVKTSLNSDDKYSLKPSYFNKVNLYYFMYSVEQLSMILHNITLLYKHNKSNFAISEIIEVRPEFIGITNFIFSDEFFELIIYSLTKLSSNSELHRYTPTHDLIVSLICLCFILKSSQNEDLNFAHKTRIDAIFATHDALGGKNIIEILNKARADISHPILSSIIDHFIKLSNAVTDPTPTANSQYKTQARASREEILKKLAGQRDDFFKHNQDWLIYKDPNKDDLEDVHTSQNDQLKLFCEICRTSETIDCPENFDIFRFSTEYMNCASTRWTRRLENIEPVEVDFSNYDVSDFSLMYDSIYSSWESKKILPALVISGCGHSFHINCEPVAFDIGNEGYTRFGESSYYHCYLCNQTNNIFLPSNCPIMGVSIGDGTKSYVGTLVNQLMCLYESGRLHEPEISQSGSVDRERYQEMLFETNLISHASESNFYFKICSIFFHEGRRKDYIYNLSSYCQCIISTMISSLKSTIDNVEKYHRHMPNQPSIFNLTFVESSNFNVSTQLSRLCYYACGLAPSFKQLGLPTDDISRLLSPFFLERLRKFRYFIMLLNISDPKSGDLNEILNIDHFEEFSSILMTISAIINLNPDVKTTLDKHWEISLVHMFYLLIVFNVFYDFHSRNNPHRTDICEDYDLESVNILWQIYASIFSPHPTPTINIQLDLYELYLFNTLPFIRKVSILFYQLFNWNSELLTGKDSLDPSIELKLLLRYLNIPDNPSTAWNLYESSFITSLKRYSALSTLNVPNMLTREQYLKNKFGLVPLPSNYLQLLIENQKLRCNSCEKPAKSSLKCLICGIMLPFKYDCGCESLTISDVVFRHIIICDGTFALFLQINPPRVVYYRMRRLKYLKISIYQDAYGESMLSSRSSLKLSEERYRRLDHLYQKDWLESLSVYIPHD